MEDLSFYINRLEENRFYNKKQLMLCWELEEGEMISVRERLFSLEALEKKNVISKDVSPRFKNKGVRTVLTNRKEALQKINGQINLQPKANAVLSFTCPHCQKVSTI